VKKILLCLPLAFMCMGCPASVTQALKNCELGQLPAEEQSVLAEVGVILMNPSAVVADLLALATKVGSAQVTCAVQAWDAFLASKGAPAGSKMLKATASDQRDHALSLTHEYLAGHPAPACASVVHM
jgi:hypothetical protein